MEVLKSMVSPHARECDRAYNLTKPTAIGKKFSLNEGEGIDQDCRSLQEQVDDWQHKPFSTWAPQDVALWIGSVAESIDFSYHDIDMSWLRDGGAKLDAMSELQFIQGDVQYGIIPFEIVQLVQSVVQRNAKLPIQEPKKRRGRPVTNTQRQTIPKKRFRLWEFLLHLLSDPTHCPSVIQWEDRENGLFRINQSSKLAELWGHYKGTKNMDFVKLSRLMRYYYKDNVLISVKQRLVYKFGPNAQGWKELSEAPACPEDIYTMCPE